MTSNWKELKTILAALRRERLNAIKEKRRTALWRTRIFHFAGLSKADVVSMTPNVNWKELRTIPSALRRERLKAERTGERSALWRTRLESSLADGKPSW